MVEQRKPRERLYRMVRRRERVEATRRRITEAAFELHGTIGPANTTIKAVAERAGVQRHTVYKHFPDLGSLFRACTEHGIAMTGMPGGEAWLAIMDPVARLEQGLGEMYDFYRANSGLLGKVLRDIEMMARVGGIEPFLERMAQLFGALSTGWPGDAPSRHLRAVAIGHALAFETWRSFADKGVSDDRLRALIVRMITTIEPSTARLRSSAAPRCSGGQRQPSSGAT